MQNLLARSREGSLMGRKAGSVRRATGWMSVEKGVLQSKQRLLETGAINDHIPEGVTERLHGYMELAMLGSADRFGRLFGWAGRGRCKAQREEFAAKSLTRLDLKSKLQGPPLKLGPDQLLWGIPCTDQECELHLLTRQAPNFSFRFFFSTPPSKPRDAFTHGVAAGWRPFH